MSTATRTPAAARRSGADLLAVAIKVKRFQPDRSDKPYWQEFQLQVEPKDRLVDALNQIKWEQDGTLTFRRSCLHGVCGSDAMRVNGRNRLACKLLMKDVGTRITIEPMLGFPVIRDLVVDMDPFFAKYEKVKPFLINDEPAPAAERLQSAEERARYDDTTKCILCGACTGSCPSVWANRDWVGPASIVNAHRFIFDSRDRAAGERLRILGDRNGVWRCRTIFNCTEACPRGIHVTDAIEEVKRAIMYGSTETE
jgi:succinate dehydrogenase / fumarate reductase iron-sulfur subunit